LARQSKSSEPLASRRYDDTQTDEYLAKEQEKFDRQAIARHTKQQQDKEDMIDTLNRQIKERNDRLRSEHRFDQEFGAHLSRDSEASMIELRQLKDARKQQ
jgi:hypothetical protein